MGEAGESDLIHILHISDLHFVKNAASYNSGEVLIREAAAKVQSVPQGKKLLIVTGDFHNFWDSDYQNAEDFLKRLAEAMGLDLAQDVFVVPGNHDVGNDGALKPFLEPGDLKWKTHKKSALQMLKNGDGDYLDERLQVFLPYCALVQRLGIYDNALGNDYPARTHVRSWRGRLNVLHLNTALIADGKAKTDQITDTAAAADPKTWESLYRAELPSIAIGHNSFYDLLESQRRDLAGTFALRNVSAYLCGDIHLTETNPERQMIRLDSGHKQRAEIPNLVAARGIADGDDTYSDVGYCWHLWDEGRDTVTVDFRKWTRNDLAKTVPNGEAGEYSMLHAAKPDSAVNPPLVTTVSGSGDAEQTASDQADSSDQDLPLLPSFKIAFTFTGEYRDSIVRPVSEELLKLGFTKDDLFFDDWHSELFTGVNADSVFKTIYHDASKCVVVLLSPNYREKLWTDHLEWPTVRSLINEGKHRKICLLNVDHVDIATIEGLKRGRDVAKAIDGLTPAEVADFIRKWYYRHILHKNPEKKAEDSPKPLEPKPSAVKPARTESALSLMEQLREGRDLVSFGSYPQTGEGEKRPIEWTVLSREADRCLLLSKHALDCMPFQKIWTRSSWESSDIRTWLNGEFLTTAFSKQEQVLIQPVTVSKERTHPSKDKKADKLFLLSVTEAGDGSYFTSDAERVCSFTDYAAAKRSEYLHEFAPDNLTCWWWLRTQAENSSRAAYVSYLGSVDTNGRNVDREEVGVRPAFWVRISPDADDANKKSDDKKLQSETAEGENRASEGESQNSGGQLAEPITLPVVARLRDGAQIVSFGKYPKEKDGGIKPIEWKVLKREGLRCLLITRYAIDAVPYHHSDEPVTWETCSLREWLNKEFFGFAFTDEEKSVINSTDVSPDRNPLWETDPGKVTKDKVFLLSIPEANELFSSDEARRCAPTAFAKEQGIFTNSKYKADGKTACLWWLRSPGLNSFSAACVYFDGSVGADVGIDVGVRPTLWINL